MQAPLRRIAIETLRWVPPLLALMLGLYIVATTTGMTIRCWSAVPFWDQWENLIFGPDQILSTWLFRQHNEHRILFPRLVFAIDTFAFDETNKFDFICNLALPFGLSVLLVNIVRRELGLGWSETLWLAGIVAGVLFSAMQFENFVWGFQVQFFGVELATAATFACIAAPRTGWASLSTALACEGIAVYTLSSGVLAAILAIPLALWAGRSKEQVMLAAVWAGGLLAAYLYGYVTPGYHSDPLRTFLRPGIALYIATEIGNPLAQMPGISGGAGRVVWAAGFGGIGLALFAGAAAIQLRRCRELGQAQIVLLALAAYAVGFAFLAALGRLEFGAEQALSGRYASPTLLFWLSLAMIGAIEVWHHYPGWRYAVMSTSITFLLILAWPQTFFAMSAWEWTLPRRDAATALLAGTDDEPALRRMFADTSLVKSQAAKLKAHHLAVFANEWSGWVGTPLLDHVRIDETAPCAGTVENTVLALPGQLRIRGSISGGAGRAVPERIVLTDAGDQVVGYGLTGFPPTGRVWHGHARLAGDGQVRAYALLDSKTACRFAP